MDLRGSDNPPEKRTVGPKSRARYVPGTGRPACRAVCPAQTTRVRDPLRAQPLVTAGGSPSQLTVWFAVRNGVGRRSGSPVGVSHVRSQIVILGSRHLERSTFAGHTGFALRIGLRHMQRTVAVAASC